MVYGVRLSIRKNFWKVNLRTHEGKNLLTRDIFLFKRYCLGHVIDSTITVSMSSPNDPSYRKDPTWINSRYQEKVNFLVNFVMQGKIILISTLKF